jgi:hypothetical protein
MTTFLIKYTFFKNKHKNFVSSFVGAHPRANVVKLFFGVINE